MKKILLLLCLFAGIAYGQAVQTLQYGIYVPRGVWSAADSSKLIMQDTTRSGTTGISGKRIIVGSLHDPAFNCVNATPVGDHFDCGGSFEKFRELEKSTSYHNAARGDSGNVFPAEFWIAITTAGDSVVIGDRTTGRVWMAFVGGATAMIEDATPVLTDGSFVDGLLRVSGTGGADLTAVDFLADRAYQYGTSGISEYQGTIQQRNGTQGWLVVNASPAIVNNTVNSVSAIRDPGGLRERGTGRLVQWWAIVVAGGQPSSHFNPYTNTITHFSGTYGAGIDNAYLSNGTLIFLYPASASNQINVSFRYSALYGLGANWLGDFGYRNDQSGAQDITWGTVAIASRIAVVERASIAGTEAPLIIVGSDSGLVALHAKANDNTNGGQQLVEFGFNSGYMKGNTTMACPMESSVGNSLADVSPYNNYLSLSGTHNYVNGMIGKADSLTNNGFFKSDHADADLQFGTGNFRFEIGFKFHTTTNPGASQLIFSAYNNPDEINLIVETDGSLYVRISDDNEVTEDAIDHTADICDGLWHYFVVQRDGNTFYLYIDGKLAGSTAVSAAAAALDPGRVYVGANTTPGSYLTATLDNWQVGKTAMSATEIETKYAQALSAMQNSATAFPNDGLTSVDVDYVQALLTGMFVAGDEDTATVSNRYGIPVQKYASPGGNIQDAALLAYGQDSVGVALVTTTRTQLIQPDVRAIDLAQYKHPYMQPAIGERVVVDSSGIICCMWTGDDATDAAFNMGRRKVDILKGTYPGFTADQYGLFYEGESDSTAIIDGANASIGISVTQDFNYFHNLAAKTTVGGSGGFDAISVANTAVETVFDHIRVLGADDDCMNIDAPRTKIANSDLRLCDDEGIDLQDESDHSIVTHTIIKDQGGDPIVVFANGESTIITSNQLEKYIIDGETSTTKANNSEVSSW